MSMNWQRSWSTRCCVAWVGRAASSPLDEFWKEHLDHLRATVAEYDRLNASFAPPKPLVCT